MQPHAYRQNHELGVFKVLIREHRLVAEMFDVLDQLSGADERVPGFEALARELLAHARAEQAIVYARLDGSRELEGEIGRARGQHDRLEVLIAKVRAADPDGDGWALALEELRRAVEAHVDEEEREIIPRAHLVIDDRAVEDLLVSYRYEKDLELTRLDRRH
jgi:hypothetical protein